MSEKYLLVAPKTPVPYPVAVSGSRGIPGGGLRLGTLDNGKGNSDHLLRFEKGVVCAALPVASVASLRKAHPAHPAAANVIDQQVVEADFVVSAMADWGSCTTCKLHDMVALWRRGLVAAVICSGPFLELGETLARTAGIPGLPRRVVKRCWAWYRLASPGARVRPAGIIGTVTREKKIFVKTVR